MAAGPGGSVGTGAGTGEGTGTGMGDEAGPLPMARGGTVARPAPTSPLPSQLKHIFVHFGDEFVYKCIQAFHKSFTRLD